MRPAPRLVWELSPLPSGAPLVWELSPLPSGAPLAWELSPMPSVMWSPLSIPDRT
ncbi:hypothetical protein LWF01_01300 [Saxibacter everestensis]|uniref:Uncharacterized protein n=1 Tax=Saxibacter everestensis TaxID=2909229 RepID=A0ABY8QTW7_9MICO|nr:hypothetical protein LWF01_01300 [Brevibacteriaceae bacterium ZFBP1038]